MDSVHPPHSTVSEQSTHPSHRCARGTSSPFSHRTCRSETTSGVMRSWRPLHPQHTRDPPPHTHILAPGVLVSNITTSQRSERPSHSALVEPRLRTCSRAHTHRHTHAHTPAHAHTHVMQTHAHTHARTDRSPARRCRPCSPPPHRTGTPPSHTPSCCSETRPRSSPGSLQRELIPVSHTRTPLSHTRTQPSSSRIILGTAAHMRRDAN